MKWNILSRKIAISAIAMIPTMEIAAQERVDFRWDARTSTGIPTRDLILQQPNELLAYVKKVNGTTNTTAIGWDNIFSSALQAIPRSPPYGTNDLFFDWTRNEPYRMSNEGLEERWVFRAVKSLFDADDHDISRGPITGEGIGAIYDVTPLTLGRMVFDFANAAAFKREGRKHKISKTALSVAVVSAPEARTNEWRGSFMLYPEFKKDSQGVLAPEVYVSGSGKTDDKVVLYTHDNFRNDGVPVYTNIGGAFTYRDLTWTNSPARGYSAKSFPLEAIGASKPASAVSRNSDLEQKAQ